MTQFLFDTLQSRSTTYDGPSGTRYIIYVNQPFIVENKQDIEFFRKKKQFREVGKKHKVEKTPDEDKKLLKKLTKIKGVSEKTAEKIVEMYGTEKKLIDAVDSQKELAEDIPKTHKNKIIEYFSKG